MKGQNLRIFIGAKCVAFATSCTFHVAAQLEDSSTKDDTGDYAKNEVTGMSWDFSCDALYSAATDATGVNGVDALDLLLAKQPVTVKFQTTAGEQNRQQDVSSAYYTGEAFINDISVNAPNRQNVTYTIQGTGNGQLTKYDPSNNNNIGG